jgi:hypothetical protein
LQQELVTAGKTNMVGDRELYNTAVELTRIMGHKNADPFFRDPSAINPVTGQLLNPPPAPPQPPPDPKLLAVQARAQLDQAAALRKAQLEQQQAQNAAIHLQVKTQGEIELAKIKTALDTKMTLLETHLKAAIRQQRMPRSFPPGAPKIKDGHHHLRDPKRTDKYLKEVHYA